MAVTRTLRMTGEVVRALLVLALLCLNFSSAAAAHDGSDSRSSASSAPVVFQFCGDLGNPAGSSDHAPCHACRLFDGVDLPAPIVIAAPLPARVALVVYLPVLALPPAPLAFATARPRGPPLA